MHLREQEQKVCDAEMESLAEEQTDPSAKTHLVMLFQERRQFLKFGCQK